MSATSTLTVIAAVAIAAAIAFAVLKAWLAARAANQFKAKALLTANELEFLRRLEAAVPELRFLAQVAMGALLEPGVTRQQDSKAYYRQRGMFAQKIVDFVAQHRKDGRVVAIIELDDRTHDSAKDARRDAMLASAGYRIIRWTSKAKPDAAAIRATLVPLL